MKRAIPQPHTDPLPVARKKAMIKQVVAFSQLGDEALTRMAEVARYRAWNRDHAFSSVRDATEPDELVLRIVVEGTVALEQRGIGQESRRIIGPGGMIGLAALVALPEASGLPDRVTFAAMSIDPTWTLDFDHKALEMLMIQEILPPGPPSTPRPPTAFQALEAAARLAAWMPPAHDALLRTEVFSAMRPDQIWPMLEYCRVVHVAGGSSLDSLGIGIGLKSAAAFVLRGAVVPYGSLDGGTLEALGVLSLGSEVGLGALLTQADGGERFVALGDAVVLVLERDALLKLPAEIPSFLRNVERGVGLPPLFRLENPAPLASWVSLVVASKGVYDTLPTHAIVELTARTIASRFGEHVAVIRLLPPGIQPTMPPSVTGGRGVDFYELSVDDDWDTALREHIGRCNFAFVDATRISAHAPDQVDAMTSRTMQLGLPVQLSTLFMEPSQREAVAQAMPLALRRWRVPIAVIEPLPEQSAAERAVGSFIDSTFGADGPLSAGAGRRVGRLARPVINVAGRLFGPAFKRFLMQTEKTERQAAWPVRTVRLVLSKKDRKVLAGLPSPATHLGYLDDVEDRERIVAGLERLARSFTRRRVGLAIGGAGAQSYCGIALIEGLARRGVPVDMVSGTSGGTLVGAVYGQKGIAGFDKLLDSWPVLLGALMSSYPSTVVLALAYDLLYGDVALNQTPITVMPVATNAWTMREWAVRGGSVGEGVRVSGSLPPYAPTVRGELMLLDGGLVADVPVRVLQDEGADLIIAASPWPYPKDLERPSPWIPHLTKLWLTTSTIVRLLNWSRGYQMAWKLSARRQLDLADVAYVEDSAAWASSVFFFAGREIVEAARKSTALQDAVDQSFRLWWELALPPNATIRLSPDGKSLLMAGQVNFRGGRSRPTLAPGSLTIVDDVLHWVDRHPSVTGVLATVRPTPQDPRIAEARCKKLTTALHFKVARLVAAVGDPSETPGQVGFSVTFSADSERLTGPPPPL